MLCKKFSSHIHSLPFSHKYVQSICSYSPLVFLLSNSYFLITFNILYRTRFFSFLPPPNLRQSLPHSLSTNHLPIIYYYLLLFWPEITDLFLSVQSVTLVDLFNLSLLLSPNVTNYSFVTIRSRTQWFRLSFPSSQKTHLLSNQYTYYPSSYFHILI